VRVLDYTPNESARSLKRRSASTIGLVIPDLANQYFALIAEGVEKAAAERDVLVVLCAPEATGQPESHHAKLLRSQRVDGVIYLSGSDASPASLLELDRLGAVVLVDERISGFDLPAVTSDNRRGAREIAAHVVDQGHERLAIIGGPTSLWTAEQRLAGYREAIAAGGCDPDAVPVYVGDYHLESGFELAERALSKPRAERPTALLCANDLMAIGALEYCKSVGLVVPRDVSIVGFDDLPVAALLTPRLTTVRQPAREMGYRAAELLFELLAGTGDSAQDGTFPTEVELRESVGPPPADA